MAYLYRYGATDPVYFKITKDRVGVSGLTLEAQDVRMFASQAGGDSDPISIGNYCSETTFGYGWYKFTPPSPPLYLTEAKQIIVNVKDNVGTAFDEDSFILLTAGDQSALFDGL